MHRTVLAVLAALASAAAAAPTCPPPGFDTRWNASNPFDLKQYVSAAWFPQQQSITSYQPSSNLYCVRAEYRIASNASDFIQVFNQGRTGSISGAHVGGLLRAQVRDAAHGKLAVGPTFLPPALYGPYWVITAGSTPPGAARYDWAIVSGGPPTVLGDDGLCQNPTSTALRNPVGSGEGLWLFTRDSVAPQSTVDAMRSLAVQLGFDISVLHQVTQSGCTYESWPPAGPAALLRG